MADNNPPPAPDIWGTLLMGALAALAPVIVRAILDGLALVEKVLPWDGTERRHAPPPSASQTP